jgi:hypothetical protein
MPHKHCVTACGGAARQPAASSGKVCPLRGWRRSPCCACAPDEVEGLLAPPHEVGRQAAHKVLAGQCQQRTVAGGGHHVRVGLAVEDLMLSNGVAALEAVQHSAHPPVACILCRRPLWLQLLRGVAAQ